MGKNRTGRTPAGTNRAERNSAENKYAGTNRAENKSCGRNFEEKKTYREKSDRVVGGNVSGTSVQEGIANIIRLKRRNYAENKHAGNK